jgi:putative transposase
MDAQLPHRKRVKHFHEPGDLHEVTFSCFHQLRLLTNDDWRRRLARQLDQANKAEGIELVAFVFMPEHVHLLLNPLAPRPRIDNFLAVLKQPFSKQIKDVLVQSGAGLLRKLTVQERPGKECFRFWQEGPGFDRNLYTAEAIAASLDYIHNNPVQRKLCRRAVDWKWSSARYYLRDPPRQQDPDLPFIHGLPVGALDRGTRP